MPAPAATPAPAPVARDAWMPTRADARGMGLSIAVLVHLGLVAALALGVQWRSSQPTVQSAELWAQVPQFAAPRESDPPPAPPPPPAPAPTPPRREATPPPPERDAEIALEQRRREQAAREQREQEQRERAAREAREREAREAREKAAREREAQREAQREAAAREQREERLAQQRREQQAREAAERAEAQREANLKRLQGLAGSTGTAQRSAGPSATYAGRIVAAVKPNIVFPDAIAGNPAAEVEVRAGPSGTILGRTLVRSSGVREWDEAVLRAIDRTETLPRDTDGRVPSSLVITFRPRD